MNSTLSPSRWIIGFLLLNLYINGIPKLITLDVLPWLAYAAGFFIFAFLVARFLLHLSGINSFGLPLHKGWYRDLGLGFAVGASVWSIKYVAFYNLGKFDVHGLMDAGFIVGMLSQALLGMLIAAAMNDIMIRGYWFAYLRKADLLKWFILLTTMLYTLDDFWNEGFDWQNLIFSVLIGLALAYTVLKTKAIWMAIGIHWGSNMLFRVMSGFDGQGVFKTTPLADSALYDDVGLLFTALLIPIVYLLLRKRYNHSTLPKSDQLDNRKIQTL